MLEKIKDWFEDVKYYFVELYYRRTVEFYTVVSVVVLGTVLYTLWVAGVLNEWGFFN